MRAMTIDEKITKLCDVRLTFTDFFYAYCAGKGIDDPEGGDLTDEEYDALEKECEGKLTYSFLTRFGEALMTEAMERVNATMGELARKG